MKRITTIFCLSILISVFLFMFVFTVFFRTEESDYSILKEWPEFSFESLFSGKFFSDITYCFTDTIEQRDRFIDLETRISDLYGIKDDKDIETHVVYEESETDIQDNESIESSLVSSNSSTDVIESSAISTPEQSNITGPDSSLPEESQPDVSEPEPETDIDVNPEMSGTILIVGTRAIEIYGGDKAGAEMYAQILNEFASRVDSNVNVYSMVIPKPSAYYIEQAAGYEKYIYRNKDDIDTISANLSDRVIDVNIYNILGNHAGEEIYLRTDTHWSALGAYYGSSVFADKAGISFPALSEYSESHREGYVGVMYKYSDYNSKILNNPEDFVVYRPHTDYEVFYYNRKSFDGEPINIDKNHDGVQDYDGFFWEIGDDKRSSWYSTFICGDNYAVKAVNKNCNNGRKLLIVKDSYGNALAPYLIDGFEEIYIVDGREYKDSVMDTIDKFDITDVLFAECTFSAVAKKEGRYLSFLKELCR